MSALRLESLRLYREALRVARSKSFSFPAPTVPGGKPAETTSSGVVTSWGSVLQKSLRSEFESNRYVTDPEAISRLLGVGFDSLNEMLKKLYEAERKRKDEILKRAAANGVLGTSSSNDILKASTIPSKESFADVSTVTTSLSSSSLSLSSSSSSSSSTTTTTRVGGIPVLGAPQLIGEARWLAAEAERNAKGIKKPSRGR
jgi:hypothetical protein